MANLTRHLDAPHAFHSVPQFLYKMPEEKAPDSMNHKIKDYLLVCEAKQGEGDGLKREEGRPQPQGCEAQAGEAIAAKT